jgi:hypothetical protein
MDPGRAATVMKIWQTAQKKYTDSTAVKEAKRRQEAMKLGDHLSDNIEYACVVADMWRSMWEVEDQPMCVNHTYPDKEILLIRIAEEANLKHCEVSIDRSDNHRVHANGRNGSTFVVRVYFGLNHGWRVSQFKSENSIVAPELPPILPQFEATSNVRHNQEGDKEEVGADGGGNDSVSDDDDDSTPSDDEGKAKAGKKTKMRSPIKSRWMVPLIKQAIKERPNMSNKECSQLLSPYMREVFLPSQILQAARLTARFEIFGDPVQNAQYTDAIMPESTARGHVVQSVIRTPSEVMSMLETIVVKEE